MKSRAPQAHFLSRLHDRSCSIDKKSPFPFCLTKGHIVQREQKQCPCLPDWGLQVSPELFLICTLTLIDHTPSGPVEIFADCTGIDAGTFLLSNQLCRAGDNIGQHKTKGSVGFIKTDVENGKRDSLRGAEIVAEDKVEGFFTANHQREITSIFRYPYSHLFSKFRLYYAGGPMIFFGPD